ncbi:ImmA/IrrE family metallo-endopeptidase [Hellea sp.]|nr:ImmA/IrrE family metallo-endopeptidase [Hellea sp.]
MKFDGPEATNLDKQSVFRIAEKAARNFGYLENFDIYEAVKSLGGKVYTKDFWAEGSTPYGSLEVNSENDFTIFVPQETSDVRDRFTIAHELGHYVLHYLWPIHVLKKGQFKLRASRYGSDRTEWEANWFASAFLMPEDEFRKLVEDEKLPISRVARHFKVSQAAASTRAKVLKINVVD